MFTRCNFGFVSLWRHLILDPTLWSPIGQFWTWAMADCEILNLHSKKHAMCCYATLLCVMFISPFGVWKCGETRSFMVDILQQNNDSSMPKKCIPMMILHVFITFLAVQVYSLLLNSQSRIMQFVFFYWFTRSRLPTIIPAFDLIWKWMHQRLLGIKFFKGGQLLILLNSQPLPQSQSECAYYCSHIIRTHNVTSSQSAW